jgi:hypothetical protein
MLAALPPQAVAAETVVAAPASAAAVATAQWDITTTATASGGWRSNVTLSSFHPVDRAFWRTEAEIIALRRFGEHWRFIGFADADLLRYFSPPPGVAGEQQFIASLEGRWQPADWSRTSLKAVGFAQSTFIDPSETEGSQQPPLWVRIRAGFSTLSQRFSLPAGFAVEPSFQAKAVRYGGYAGDYNESRPGIRLLWTRSPALELSAAYFAANRAYSELTASTAGNRPLPGHRLSLRQHEAELRAKTQWRDWTVTAEAGRLENRDHTQGFLDYNQRRASIALEWEHGAWHATVRTEARRLDYLVQKVGVGTERPPRLADAYDLSARLERDLGHNWSVFLENRWERTRSNVVDDAGAHPFSYRTNMASAGVQRTF